MDYSDDESELITNHTIDSIAVKVTSLTGLKKIIKESLNHIPKIKPNI